MRPTDGKHSITRQACAVSKFVGVMQRHAAKTALLLCASAFLAEISVVAADRPRLFPRVFGTGKNDQRPKNVSSKTVTPSSTDQEPADGSIQRAVRNSAESASRGRRPDITPSETLSRFPKPTAPASDHPDEILIDSEEPATPIDLPAALQLGGWTSPEVLLAQQRVLAVTARQQLAAAQALPNLNIGANYDKHTGGLQRASGIILQVERSALYVGAGGNAVAAGTVNIPGLQYNLNVGETYFAYLVSRQQSERSRAAESTVRNNTLLLITEGYCQLVRNQGTRAIAVQARNDAAEVAHITAAFAKVGQGRDADAERATTELEQRAADVLQADASIVEASARLGQVLNLESSVRLQSSESWVVPRSVVPDLIPLPELIAISLYQRPEVAEHRAEVHSAMLELSNAKLLLFSPQFIAGLSGGAFGGGSNVVAATGNPQFGDFASRNDQDVVLYWSIRNLGLANKALIKSATARLAAADWERTKQFNLIRAEVAQAFAQTQARAAQLDIRERAVATSEHGFREDLRRARAGEGHPIEVLDSLRLRAKAQQDYLDTIADYNQAQYRLYVAIGQPPADLLIHANPPTELPSPSEETK